jgi:hypothetical protein
MRFLSLVPETEKDVHDVDVGNMAVRELLFASGRVASLVEGAKGCRCSGGNSTHWLLNSGMLGF